MNNTPNYPFYCGYLISALEGIGYDRKFEKLETVEDRMNYLKGLVEEARLAAVKHENELNEVLKKAA